MEMVIPVGWILQVQTELLISTQTIINASFTSAGALYFTEIEDRTVVLITTKNW
jgi:hypothetical protein